MSKKMSIKHVIMVFLLVIFLSNNEYVYAEDYNDVYVKLISSQRYENANQEGLTVEEVLIRVTGATFKEDISYTNYNKAFEVLKCPPGYGIDTEVGGVKRVSPQVLQVRIRGEFPLLKDDYFTIKFKDTAFNENEREIYIREDGVVKIALNKGPNVKFENDVISENEIRNGFMENSFYDFPIIKTDVGSFRKDISKDDIKVTELPLGYEHYVEYKSDNRLYFTIVPKDPENIILLNEDYTCSVYVNKSAYEEDVKISPSPIKLKLEKGINNLYDELKFTIALDQEALIEYKLIDNKENVIMSGLKGCKQGKNILLIDGNILRDKTYYIVLKNKTHTQIDEKIDADVTIEHNHQNSKTWNVILSNTIESDENIVWQLDTAVFKIDKITSSEYDIELLNQNIVSVDLNNYEEKDISSGEVQPTYKKFNIEFNHELNVNENLYNGIYVIEDNNTAYKKVPAIVEYNVQDLKKIQVHPPKSGWEQGKVYYIIIEPNIQSIHSRNLAKGVKARFEVK